MVLWSATALRPSMRPSSPFFLEQCKQRCPDLPVHRNFPILLGEPQGHSRPAKRHDPSSTACVFLENSSRQISPERHPRGIQGRCLNHLNCLPGGNHSRPTGPPHWEKPVVNPLGDRAPHLIWKRMPSHPAEETQCSRVISSFWSWPKALTSKALPFGSVPTSLQQINTLTTLLQMMHISAW